MNQKTILELSSTGGHQECLQACKTALQVNPEETFAYKYAGKSLLALGQFEKAQQCLVKAHQLDGSDPETVKDIGNTFLFTMRHQEALRCYLFALKLNPSYPHAINNLNSLITNTTLNRFNSEDLRKAYETLISVDTVSHQELSRIFIQEYLSTINEASKSHPIISADNNALNNLAADWRLRKSITLFIPPHKDIEHFLTRLRVEFIKLAVNQKPIQENLKALAEALATQCFLNEYVYTQSPEEEKLVNQLIHALSGNQEAFNQYLAIAACYRPISELSLNQDWLKAYPSSTEESKVLFQTQLEEPQEEERIKATIQSDLKATDAVSAKVQEMYEENPYPRYRHANHADKSIAQNISKVIGIESTKQDLQFKEVLTSNHSRPKVLIAGCGTGNQVINASRYKNTQIKAIDLSSRSLAYAIRKAKEYGMDNVDFKKMDLLDVAALNETFDTIECSGVLHHMEDPAKGLSALRKQLKPGGYIKLGLYSDIARKDIVKARNLIKHLGLRSTPDDIRKFRQQVFFKEELKDLSKLTQLGRGFYSLSELRDLCFHVQEHRFTTEALEKLLDSEELIFCGFMLPEQIKKLYQEQYPEDNDMTSLKNWGDFEQQHPSTFGRMYQFWAYKPF